MSRCIFCKSDSSQSRSREHILPESVGNKEGVLPPGIVCDSCNNYFSSKIETKVLGSAMLQSIRRTMQIETKKGKLPAQPPISSDLLPSYRLMARFVGKVGLECLAARLLQADGWELEVIDNAALDPVRQFVRYNVSEVEWTFSFRTLYPMNAVFDDGHERYQVLNEYDLLYTEKRELFIILALFGVELAMNLGGPEIEGYMEWLLANDGRSPLYIDKRET